MSRSDKGFSRLVTLMEGSYLELGASGRGILLAVSGGADSTALLVATARLAGRLGLRAEVASIDHGLRRESSREVLRVKRLAKELKLPFHTRRLRLARGPGVEERAREARYAALEAIRARRGLDLIATAHTVSDQAETVLMRLGRGASLRGAAGILARRGNVVRPMLRLTRAEVEDFLALERIAFIEDPMNVDRSFARVRVRMNALPALEGALGPGVAKNLARFARGAAEDEAFLSARAAVAFKRLSLAEGVLDAAGVRALESPLRRRVLARLLELSGVPPDAEQLECAGEALSGEGSATLGRDRLLRAESGLVRVVPAPPRQRAARPRSRPRKLVPGASVVDPRSGLTLALSDAGGEGPLCLGIGPAPLPLTVRHRRPGDRANSRKLNDLLIDLRVAEEDRDRIPLVFDAEGRLLWVAGFWPKRQAGGQEWFLRAAPTKGSRAHEWLFRYSLAPRPK